METRADIKDCKKCGGKGHVKGVPCEACCTHSGAPLADPKNPDRYVCGQGCGKEMKNDSPKSEVILGGKKGKAAKVGNTEESAKDRKNRLARERRAAKK